MFTFTVPWRYPRPRKGDRVWIVENGHAIRTAEVLKVRRKLRRRQLRFTLDGDPPAGLVELEPTGDRIPGHGRRIIGYFDGASGSVTRVVI